MKRLGRDAGASAGGLEAVLSDRKCNSSAGERPILNHMTVYSAIMSPSPGDDLPEGGLKVILRDPIRSDSCA